LETTKATGTRLICIELKAVGYNNKKRSDSKQDQQKINLCRNEKLKLMRTATKSIFGE